MQVRCRMHSNPYHAARFLSLALSLARSLSHTLSRSLSLTHSLTLSIALSHAGSMPDAQQPLPQLVPRLFDVMQTSYTLVAALTLSETQQDEPACLPRISRFYGHPFIRTVEFEGFVPP